MRDEIAMFRAVSQARQDISAGIDTSTAIQAAAKRYSVNVDAVDAHVRIAHRECCRAATEVENGARY